jgi:NADH-quinone oxidoreductase subunit J
MTTAQLFFLLAGVTTLIASIMVVTSPKLIHAGLWLILALAGIAVLFVFLESGFLAVVQVAVYIDAIAILIIITVMLTRAVMRETEPQINREWILAGLAVLLLFAGLLALLTQIPDVHSTTLTSLPDAEVILEDLGTSLVDVDQYVLPFEVASILLVAALVGAIVVARTPKAQSEDGGDA